MNKYRYVRYADDGCHEYQCLACKETWVARWCGANFCGHCGVKFESKYECRPHEIPRWAYDRYGAHPPFGVQLYPQPKPEGRCWIIQSRSKWRGEEWTKWGYDGRMGREYDYQAVKRWLDMKRADLDPDDCYQIEYRAIIGAR